MTEHLPTAALRESFWILSDRQSSNTTRDSSITAVSLGSSYWVASFTFENLSEQEMRNMHAFLSRRKGRLNPFYGRDVYRRKPANDANATNTGLTITLDLSSDPKTLRIDGVSSNTLSEGDLVSYKTANGSGTFNGRYLGEVTNVVSSGPTHQILELEPTLRAAHATPDIAIADPFTNLVLDPGSLQVSRSYNRRNRVSFTATQVMRGV